MKDILIIEDDASILEVLRIFCLQCNQSCRGATSLESAIEEVRKKKPDLILLDLLLGTDYGTTIIDLARRLYSPAPKIVVMSAMTNAKKISNSYDVPFLEKPFDLDLIEEIIRENNYVKALNFS